VKLRRPPVPVRTPLRAALLAAALGVLALPGRADPEPDALRIVSYNLQNYAPQLTLRGKPDAAYAAIHASLAALDADIIVAQELASERAARHLQEALAEGGADYPHMTMVDGPDWVRRQVIFSRTPPAAISHSPHQVYKIKDTVVPVRRGFGHCIYELAGYRLHLVTAHLKSRVHHALGQSDMRRYEARQLRYLVDDIIKREPDANVLVIGDMNDAPDTSPIKSVINRRYKPAKRLYDLRPVDSAGLCWTYFYASADRYSRIDYAFATQQLLPELRFAECRVVDFANWYTASDHRPLLISIGIGDQPLTAAHAALFRNEIRDAPPPTAEQQQARRKAQRTE
jgi:endonuclease/exonuclease/phosphatase family metal-dependent hydrolase